MTMSNVRLATVVMPLAVALAVVSCGEDSSGSTAAADGGVSGGEAVPADGGAPATPPALGPKGDAAAPADFWDATAIPPAKNVMVFKFMNRSNGALQDSEIYWRFQKGNVTELHSIAEQPFYDMPANASGRMYFYVCKAGDATCAADPSKSKYYDFIEHTIGAAQYNGNTTRVDAFGLKIAMKLHCADGFERAVGEDYPTFAESREATFQRYLADVPDEFKATAQPPFAPYRIVQPGAAGFDQGGAHALYYAGFVDELWAANQIGIPKPGPNGSGLGAYPNLSAAIFRHVGATAGTFDAAGMLLDKELWKNSATFYTSAPANYYARFWHANGIDGKAYGFPYDDVGGYSTYVSHANPQYMLVAVGW